MPEGSRRELKPCDYAVTGDHWPYAEMQGVRQGQIGQAVARALAEAMEARGYSANGLAKASGVNRQVISNILYGVVWADLFTIASLEETLDWTLWPDHTTWPTNDEGVRHQPLPGRLRSDEG